MSCVIVMILALVFNLVNFFLYKIEFCKSDLIPRSFTMHRWWSIYGYARELLTRVMPIILLVIANIILIGIVRSSRNRMKKNRGNNSAAMTKQQSVNNQENIEFIDKNGGNKDQKATIIDIQSSSTGANKKPAVSRNRQENQLTTMTIFVAIMYVISSIPMVFAYPGLLFSAEQTTTKTYKFYAALVNILELLQCSFRFLIYFCFTTQFRLKFYELQKKLANLSVDVESHLLLPDHSLVPLNYLLVGNMTPDALGELLQANEKIRLHSIIAHPEKMLQCTLELFVRRVAKAH